MRRRSGYGWFELVIGILLVIFGIMTFFRPSSTLTWLVVLYGIIAVVLGVSDILFYMKTERFTGFGPAVSLVTGILSVMVGVMLLAHPSAGTVVLVVLMPIWFIAHSISRLSHLTAIRLFAGDFYYYATLIVNIAGLVLGILMIVRPYVSVLAAGVIIGIYMILTGADMILAALSNMGTR